MRVAIYSVSNASFVLRNYSRLGGNPPPSACTSCWIWKWVAGEGWARPHRPTSPTPRWGSDHDAPRTRRARPRDVGSPYWRCTSQPGCKQETRASGGAATASTFLYYDHYVFSCCSLSCQQVQMFIWSFKEVRYRAIPISNKDILNVLIN